MADAARTAIVTGAGSGIGQAVSHCLKDRGYTVITIDKVASEHTDFVADLTRTEDIERVSAALPEWDVLVHSAGVGTDAPPVLILGLNVVVPRILTQAIAGRAKHGAAVLGIASVAAQLSEFDEAIVSYACGLELQDVAAFADEHALTSPLAYRLSKEALLFWMRSEAASDAPYRVNCVSPGPVATPMWDRVQTTAPDATAMLKDTLAEIPTAAQIAPAIVELCSPNFFWVNGGNLPLDGGLGARLALKKKTELDVET
ncbi:SDR family oxidoreductase [Cognatishimia sp.]|uniref:SDR family oxidoreductase n=1 Tax=Cognatishimia sp. TaxID=2211648 RepID=UPI0035183D27|nr:SDR family oxidoreductase [Cognatishimia sp.]